VAEFEQLSGVSKAPVSAIIPTYNRVGDLSTTLDRILKCNPVPEETLVHVDAEDEETADWLRRQYPSVRILESSTPQGPGGGRNRLLSRAEQPYAASFDDDSYPIDADYFESVVEAFNQHSNAGVLSASIFVRGEEPPKRVKKYKPVSSFVGCGCAYRLRAWKEIEGYVPLQVAYGMEEADVSLQLLDKHWRIMEDRRLRVFHDTEHAHHEEPHIVAASLANRALLGFLRYPPLYWPLAFGQFLSRILWSIREGRTEGVWEGIRQTPGRLWALRKHRDPVDRSTLRHARKLDT
jgi:GT2 family glycosyltransferase